MKFVSFNKYKEYLESFGYEQDKDTGIYEFGNVHFIAYYFSKPDEKLRYLVNVYTDKDYIPNDHVLAIYHGYGDWYDLRWNSVKIDMRKKFWKKMVEDDLMLSVFYRY